MRCSGANPAFVLLQSLLRSFFFLRNFSILKAYKYKKETGSLNEANQLSIAAWIGIGICHCGCNRLIGKIEKEKINSFLP
jgi:hypothetical protein